MNDWKKITSTEFEEKISAKKNLKIISRVKWHLLVLMVFRLRKCHQN
jgi:hypothetical protein